MTTTLEIRLKKVNKIYHEWDNVAGFVVIQSKNEAKHDGITLSMEGSVVLQLSSKNVGIFEAFYNSIKPLQLLGYNLEICKPGKLPAGKTEIPFEFPLRPKGNKTLYETYHGVFVNIQYLLKCDMKRPLLNKDLQKVAEFIVEYKDGEKASLKPVEFYITPESLQNVKEGLYEPSEPTPKGLSKIKKSKIPRFAVKGKLNSTICCISQPLTGELMVERCEVPIKSIELQLVRVETCGCAEGYAKDATEIQNIQIGEGDVNHCIAIPIYMIFPRLFTCPTLVTTNFKVEFEVNIVIIFHDDHLINENFPIKLTRF